MAESDNNTPSATPITDVFTDALDFYPINGGTEYGVMIGRAVFMETIVIPASYNGKPVTTILPKAFENTYGRENDVLTSVIIPSSVTRICDDAFANCPNLQHVDIPSSVTDIGYLAFYGMLSVSIDRAKDDVPEGQVWGEETFGCYEIIWKK